MSFKNILPQRDHKERSQPKHRKKLGLLEKKKDYKIRARDYQKKRDLVRSLKEKAAFRNPDEFYYQMETTKRRDGVHEKVKSSRNYTKKQIVDMQTQDIGYLVNKKNEEEKKIAKLTTGLQLLSETPVDQIQSKHTIFVDDENEVESFDPEKYFETPRELLGRCYNRPTEELLENTALTSSTKVSKKLSVARTAAYQELLARKKREKQLHKSIQKIQLKKNLTVHPGVRKRRKSGRVVYSWDSKRSK